MAAVIGLGMAMIAAGLLVLATVVDGSGIRGFLAATALLGAGVAFAATPATEAIVAALPPEKQGVASALNDLTRELGGVLGIAVLGSVFNSTYREDVGRAAEELPAGLPQGASDTARDSLAGALHVADEVGGARGAEFAGAAREAFNSGMSSALVGGLTVVALGGAVAVALLRRVR